MNIFYQTRRLCVAFDYDSDKIQCVIYRKGTALYDNWKVLQSYSIRRKGFTRLDKRTQKAALRQMIKAMRHRQTMALRVLLNNKDVVF